MEIFPVARHFYAINSSLFMEKRRVGGGMVANPAWYTYILEFLCDLLPIKRECIGILLLGRA